MNFEESEPIDPEDLFQPLKRQGNIKYTKLIYGGVFIFSCLLLYGVYEIGKSVGSKKSLPPLAAKNDSSDKIKSSADDEGFEPPLDS